MPVILPEEDHPVKYGSLRVEVALTDSETGLPATLLNGSWDLTDRKGDIVNGRANVPIPSQSTFIISLQGQDNAIKNKNDTIRHLLLKGDYLASTGNETFRDYVEYYIIDSDEP